GTFGLEPLRESGRLVVGELAVEQIQCLDRRGRLTTARHALAGVRTIESTEDRLPFHPDLVSVDHAPAILFRRLLDGNEAGKPATFVEEVEPASTGFGIEPPAYREN